MKFSFLPVEVKFFDYFQAATANLLEGAKVLQGLLDDYHDVEVVAARLAEIEHQGDAIVHEVTSLLPRTLITPFDHDDIQHLILAVDVTLDTIHATATRLAIYQVPETKDHARRLAHLIVEAATELELAVKGLQDKKNYPQVQEHILQINTLEKKGDRVFEEALRNLVEHRDDFFDFIRWKEIYESLELATDCLEDAGAVIQRVMIANA